MVYKKVKDLILLDSDEEKSFLVDNVFDDKRVTCNRCVTTV